MIEGSGTSEPLTNGYGSYGSGSATPVFVKIKDLR
jgi:hypothetical protein